MRHVSTPVVYGPPAPMIAFWYRNHYLGVTTGHPSNIEDAREKLMRSVREQATPHSLFREVYQLSHAGAQLKCGFVVRDLSFTQ